MHRLRRVAAGAFAGLLILAGTTPVSAHEQRDVGPAQLVVGWAEEPAYVGFRNAVQLRVSRGETPVEGPADPLRVEVTFGSETIGPLEMRPVFDAPGEYRTDLIPTAPGAYTFHFTGEIEGQPLDETFESGPETFDEVRGTSEITFPEQAPPNSELAAAIEGIGGRIDEAAVAASDAESAASAARTLGFVGVGLGALALIGAAIAFLRRGTT